MAAHGEAFVYDKEEGIKLQTRKSMKKKTGIKSHR